MLSALDRYIANLAFKRQQLLQAASRAEPDSPIEMPVPPAKPVSHPPEVPAG